MCVVVCVKCICHLSILKMGSFSHSKRASIQTRQQFESFKCHAFLRRKGKSSLGSYSTIHHWKMVLTRELNMGFGWFASVVNKGGMRPLTGQEEIELLAGMFTKDAFEWWQTYLDTAKPKKNFFMYKKC